MKSESQKFINQCDNIKQLTGVVAESEHLFNQFVQFEKSISNFVDDSEDQIDVREDDQSIHVRIRVATFNKQGNCVEQLVADNVNYIAKIGELYRIEQGLQRTTKYIELLMLTAQYDYITITTQFEIKVQYDCEADQTNIVILMTTKSYK